MGKIEREFLIVPGLSRSCIIGIDLLETLRSYIDLDKRKSPSLVSEENHHQILEMKMNPKWKQTHTKTREGELDGSSRRGEIKNRES